MQLKFPVAVFLVFVITFGLLSCSSSNKEVIYSWQEDGETRQLTLKKNGIFVFEIDRGYYSRIDSGNYIIDGDTLKFNPGKKTSLFHSIVPIDSTFNGKRFMEVLGEEVTIDKGIVAEEFFRAVLFPTVTVNGHINLSIDPDDPTFKKLIIPDTLEVTSVECTVQIGNSCTPFVVIKSTVPKGSRGKSYRMYLNSPERKENYLAGYKWLFHGDKVYPCDDNNPKLVKEEK